MKKKTISPSSLSYLIECERCFWINSNGIRQPGIFPGILNRVHSLVEGMVKGGYCVSDLLGDSYKGSKWFGVEKREKVLYKGYTISGRLDTGVVSKDGYVDVIDWKTSAKPDMGKYERQLQVYGYMLECKGYDVRNLNVVGLWPKKFTYFPPSEKFFSEWEFTPHMVKYSRDKAKEILDKAIAIIELEDCPELNPKCGVCEYVRKTRGL